MMEHLEVEDMADGESGSAGLLGSGATGGTLSGRGSFRHKSFSRKPSLTHAKSRATIHAQLFVAPTAPPAAVTMAGAAGAPGPVPTITTEDDVGGAAASPTDEDAEACVVIRNADPALLCAGGSVRKASSLGSKPLVLQLASAADKGAFLALAAQAAAERRAGLAAHAAAAAASDLGHLTMSFV